MQATKDMVFYKEGNRIMSGGMQINSILMAIDAPVGFAKKEGCSSDTHDMLGNAVVPAGLVVLQDHFNSRVAKPSGIKLNSCVIDESMVTALTHLNSHDKKERKTRRQKKHKEKKTRRHK